MKESPPRTLAAAEALATWWSSAGEGVGELRVSRNGVRLDFVDVVPQIRELFKQ